MDNIIAFPTGGNFEPWVSKKVLARHLGISTRWVELRQREGLPSQLVGRCRRYRITEVEAWLREVGR
jgi:hypothetical protein